MSTSTTHPGCLQALGQTLTTAALANELAERLRAGSETEVETFLRTILDDDLHPLRWLGRDDAPWARDYETWLAFARLTIPLGVLFDGGIRYGGVSWRCAELSRALEKIARDTLLLPESADFSIGRRARFILTRLFQWFWYPDIPRQEALRLLEWAEELRALAGATSTSMLDPDWDDLLAALDDADLLDLAVRGGELYADICKVYLDRHRSTPHPERCAPWYDFVREHHNLFDWVPIDKDPGLIALRWELGTNAEQREKLVELLLSNADHEPAEYYIPILNRLVLDDPAPFVKWMESWRPRYHLDPVTAEQIWHAQYPELLPFLVPSILMQSRVEPFLELLGNILVARPACFHEIPTVRLAKLLPQLDPAVLREHLPLLGELLSASGSRALREAVAGFMRTLEVDAVVDTFSTNGWLSQRNKNMQLACRDILLAHPDPAVSPLLLELLRGGLDLGSESQVEEHLQKLGVAVPGMTFNGQMDLPALEARVARFKRPTRAINVYDTPQILALFAPFSDHAARVLLHLAATAEDDLPPLAEQMLAHIPAENRARLSLELVKTWVTLDGDPKARWALRLANGNSDDRVVNTLTAAVQAWGKPKKLRAVIAVEQLGALDTIYALSQVQALSTSRKLKDLVIDATHDTLKAAAERRGLSVLDLYDELTPHFGLGGGHAGNAEGLVLTVGSSRYRVELQGDLSLRVVDEKGKASKSLPAAKDPALRLEWEAANAQLKTTAAGIKTIVKQQGPRLRTALITGQIWSVERWRRLFQQHPLLRILARSLIWRVEGGPSFRIAEDFSLVDAADDGVTLPEHGLIKLWHPVDATAQDIECWRACLADYEVEPLIDQIGASATLPGEQQWRENALHPVGPLEIAQGALAGLLTKWNYRPGQVGDGPGIYEHTLDLPGPELLVELRHERYMPYMDLNNLVVITSAAVHDTSQRDEQGRWRTLRPEEWPLALQATLMAQFAAIAAKAAQNKERS